MRDPTTVTHPDLKAITVFLASTATPARGGLPYLDPVLPAEDRLAATRVVRDLGTLPPDAILYLLAQPLLDLASDHLLRDRDLTMRYEERFEVEDSDEWSAAMAEYNREADAITAATFRAQAEAAGLWLPRATDLVAGGASRLKFTDTTRTLAAGFTSRPALPARCRGSSYCRGTRRRRRCPGLLRSTGCWRP